MTQFPNINIVYEESNLLVIDKPVGLVVHPGAGLPAVASAKAGKHDETLADWFLKKYPEIQNLDWPDKTRAGIVHRLDKDTSGLMILAKNPEALKQIQTLFQSHQIHKSYLALVLGKFDKKQGEITSFIGRDPHHRRRQSSQTIYFDWQPGKKREAKTRYKVLKEYKYHDQILSLIEATLETGRTHQIRVQFKSIGHPVIGDQTYNIKHSRKISKELGLKRQFLHAYKLKFDYGGGKFSLKSTLPKDLKSIVRVLK